MSTASEDIQEGLERRLSTTFDDEEKWLAAQKERDDNPDGEGLPSFDRRWHFLALTRAGLVNGW